MSRKKVAAANRKKIRISTAATRGLVYPVKFKISSYSVFNTTFWENLVFIRGGVYSVGAPKTHIWVLNGGRGLV